MTADCPAARPAEDPADPGAASAGSDSPQPRAAGEQPRAEIQEPEAPGVPDAPPAPGVGSPGRAEPRTREQYAGDARRQDPRDPPAARSTADAQGGGDGRDVTAPGHADTGQDRAECRSRDRYAEDVRLVAPGDDGPGQVRDENADATRESFEPGAAKRETLAEVEADSGLTDPEQRMAVSDAYDVVYEYPAALMVKTAQEMLPDLRHDVRENPDSKIAFVGRDGRSLALAVRVLDPEFFEEHCTEVVLSRALAETAVQDLELREGRAFPELDDFRGAAGKVDPADTVGAYRQVTDYLRRQGASVGEPGSHVTLVDTSYKGTVQELLAAMYPETEFTGRYAFFAASPADPHPGSKTGYAMHLEGAAANGGRPVQEMPEDPALTYSSQDALAAIEETLHGPMSSPKRITAAVPEQLAVRDDPALLDGFNPTVVPERFTDPSVRDAVMRAALGAVANRAREVSAGGNSAWQALLRSAGHFRDEVRSWASGSAADPRVGEYLDAFVRRTDKRPAAKLSEVIRTAGIDGRLADETWEAFGKCPDVTSKDAFVSQFSQRITGKE